MHAGVLGACTALIDEFERIVNGMAMLGERPPRSVDEAVAIGERLSALLVAAYLESQRHAAGGGQRRRASWSPTPSSATPRR